MFNEVNQFLSAITQSELARTTRHSAWTVWNAHRAAFRTTGREAGKVVGLAIAKGRKFAAGDIVRPARGKGTKTTRARIRKTQRATRRAA
jgi:hypothetical protein